ncbi:MAG: TetR/AcrR family transcriptional regulator [Oscillospiraceae bacterium]|nr:TetR/AcrR family transcriptional regulator [Oscillospiraceae bacterium]
MLIQNEGGTKEKILKVAARMFSERGYDKVTTREISKDIGINAASIYHHFASKEDILNSLYSLYSSERRRKYPNLDELLRLAETEPPHDVLMRSIFHYNEESVEILDQILITAVRRLGSDIESERFIQENIIESISSVLRPLLERLVDLKKIKPFDIDAFLSIVNFYCFSAAALNNSSFRLGIDEHQAGMALIFSMIVPVK